MASTFHVETTDGAYVSGKPLEKQEGFDEAKATADAEQRNRKAEELGLKTRYVVKPTE